MAEVTAKNAPVVTMKQLLEAGVHFGHQTRRWNPKMKRFIFGERNGIYIIDLQQTLERIDTAYRFVRSTVENGGTVLFVGTSALGWSWRPCAPHCGRNPQTDEVRPTGSPAGSAWRQADARI